MIYNSLALSSVFIALSVFKGVFDQLASLFLPSDFQHNIYHWKEPQQDISIGVSFAGVSARLCD